MEPVRANRNPFGIGIGSNSSEFTNTATDCRIYLQVGCATGIDQFTKAPTTHFDFASSDRNRRIFCSASMQIDGIGGKWFL